MSNPVVSFFEKVGKEFVSIFKKSPTYVQLLQAAVTYLGPIAVAILAIVDPLAVPEATSILGIIQADLATLSMVAKSGQVAPGSTAAMTIETALNSIQTNSAALLELAGIKNSEKASQITALVTLVNSEAQALLTGLSAVPATA